MAIDAATSEFETPKSNRKLKKKIVGKRKQVLIVAAGEKPSENLSTKKPMYSEEWWARARQSNFAPLELTYYLNESGFEL